MYEEIIAWINSGMDFNQGMLLYDRYGLSASQKRLFHLSGPTVKNRSALEYELKKMIRGKSPAPAGQRSKVSRTPAQPRAPMNQKKKSSVRISSKRSKSKIKGKGAKTRRKPKLSKMK